MAKKKMNNVPALTRAEEEIMQHIWRLEKCTVTDILNIMSKPAPPHSSVSSIVRLLEKKGYVDHKAYGRTYEYYPIISKDGVRSNRIKNLISQYFGGSPDALVNFLVTENTLTPDELKELLKKLDKK